VTKSSLGDAKSSLGDAKSSLGDTKSSLGDAKSSLGDAKRFAGRPSGATRGGEGRRQRGGLVRVRVSSWSPHRLPSHTLAPSSRRWPGVAVARGSSALERAQQPQPAARKARATPDHPPLTTLGLS
jgi:hypothetical protein